MKKIFSIVLAALFFYTLCFALELEETRVREGEHQPFVKEMRYKTDKNAELVVNSNSFIGRIDSIIAPGGDTGSKYTIAVVNNKGDKMDFTFVPGLITIRDFKKNILKLKDIKAGDDVTIEYILMKNGENRVMSITLE
jgi:hypothetical protein